VACRTQFNLSGTIRRNQHPHNDTLVPKCIDCGTITEHVIDQDEQWWLSLQADTKLTRPILEVALEDFNSQSAETRFGLFLPKWIEGMMNDDSDK